MDTAKLKPTRPKPSTRKIGDMWTSPQGITYKISLSKNNRRYWARTSTTRLMAIPAQTQIPRTFIPTLIPRTFIPPIFIPKPFILTLPPKKIKTIKHTLCPLGEVCDEKEMKLFDDEVGLCDKKCEKKRGNKHGTLEDVKPCELLSEPPCIPKTATLSQTLQAILKFRCVRQEDLRFMYEKNQDYMYDFPNSILKNNDYKVAGAIYLTFIQKAIIDKISTVHFDIKPSRFTSYFVNLQQSPGEIEWKHGTMIIMDNQKKTAEYFDPHGKSNFNRLKSTDIALKEWVRENLPSYKYIPTVSICPAIGPQAMTGDSYCVSWTTLYTYIRIKHNDLAPMSIIKELLYLRYDELVKIVESFVCFQYQYLVDSGVKDIIDAYDQVTYVPDLKILRVMRMRGEYNKMCNILFA